MGWASLGIRDRLQRRVPTIVDGDGVAPARVTAIPVTVLSFIVRGNHSWPAPLIVIAFVFLGWILRFVQDDALIAFRYARNLVEYGECTWNPGLGRIEGYTSPLWVLLLAIAHAWHWDPVMFSQVLGLFAGTATLVVTHRTALRVLGDPGLARMAILLLCSNYTFLAYCTGGLETSLHAALVNLLLLAAISFRDSPPIHESPRLAAISSLAGVAVLARPESLLFALPALASTLSHRRTWRSLRCFASATMPVAAIVLSFLYWRHHYYGAWLPNTFAAKTADVSLARGAWYIAYFVYEYAWAPLLFLFVLRTQQVRNRQRHVAFAVAIVALWLAYVVSVGGCFMEFRLLVPILPLSVILLSAGLALVPSRRARALILSCLIVASAYHAIRFKSWRGVESIGRLAGHLERDRWCDIGRALGATFPGLESHGKSRVADERVVIAATAVGAVAYYSRLPVIDMYGMNDAWIARHGEPTGSRPGHHRIATESYLVERGVHLILGFPVARPAGPPLHLPLDPGTGDPFGIAGFGVLLRPPYRVVEIPLDDVQSFLALYARPSAEVDDAIRRGLVTCTTIAL